MTKTASLFKFLELIFLKDTQFESHCWPTTISLRFAKRGSVYGSNLDQITIFHPEKSI